MRINAKAGTQHATTEGGHPGEGLAVFFSQNPADVGRYRFSVSAITDQGTLLVGTFYSSPPSATSPTGQLTRMLAGAVIPGATGWAVDVACMNPATAGDETADIILVSSKCCTGPIGVSRVNQRYLYYAGSAIPGPTTIQILAGQVIKSWAATAPGAIGAVTLNFVSTGNTIIVPAGLSVSAEPGNQFLGNSQSITFTNVDYFIEILESA